MFSKSRLLVAAAFVVGTASIAAAQVDSDDMMSYERSGPVLNITGVRGGDPNKPFDEDQQNSYGPIGASALARVTEPAADTLPRGGNPNRPFDEDQQNSYGVNGAPQ